MGFELCTLVGVVSSLEMRRKKESQAKRTDSPLTLLLQLALPRLLVIPLPLRRSLAKKLRLQLSDLGAGLFRFPFQ